MNSDKKSALNTMAAIVFIIAAMVLSGIYIPGCWYPVERIKTENLSNATIKKEAIQIVTVGNHQYLWISTSAGAGLCHYEDCEYCKRK